MTRLNRFLAAAVLAAVAFAPDLASAASQIMCAPDATAASRARFVTNPATNNSYTLNGQGCALMLNTDAAFFGTQGFTQVGTTPTLLFFAQTTGFSFVVPASAYIRNIIAQEMFNSAVPGNAIKFGTNTGSSDVATMSGLALTLAVATDVSIAKRVLSATVPTTVFVAGQQGAGFGSGSWNFTIEFGFF